MKDKYIAIVGAVKEEIIGIKRELDADLHESENGFTFWAGTWQRRYVVLVQSGVGEAKAVKALTAISERYPLSLVISMGYAGGADTTLQVGDLVIADRVVETASGTDIALDSKYVDYAAGEEPFESVQIVRGGLATVKDIVYIPEAKQELGKGYSVLAMEMETAGMAHWAGERGIPILSVRAISDTANQELINMESLKERGGEVSRLKAGWYVLTHPGSIKDFVALAHNARIATANLTRFLGQFLLKYS